MIKKFQNYINGKWQNALSGKTFENRNPADPSDLIGTFPLSGLEDVNQAIKSAKEALTEWRLTPAPHRGALLKHVGDIMSSRKEEISMLMTREMGKVLLEARGDTQEGIDTAYYAFGEGRRLFGHTVPSELPNKFNMTTRIPVGVCGLICPWNFPIAIPTWKVFPALLCGNTVVLKPAHDTPASANLLVEILEEAGLPKGVVNLVHGTGAEVGSYLVSHKDVQAISFTGSSKVGALISSEAAKSLKRVSCELGGKNAQIVLPDAQLELALEGVLWGAFGTTGQRCTATSRLILHEKIHDSFLKQLISKAEKIKVGNGLDPTSQMGPIINQSQFDKVHDYVQIGQREGAVLETGGSPSHGLFYPPTIFSHVKPKMTIAKEEIFGPVLSVIKVKSFEEAITVANNSEYGLSSSVYTSSINDAYFAIQGLQAGITYINSPTIGAECHMPFGGVKHTGNGHRGGGWEVFDFYTETKTSYIDFSGRLQRAQIDT